MTDEPEPETPEPEAREPDNCQPSCPICGRPAVPATRPFCSKRCADVDLHRWLSGGYAVPTHEEPDTDEA